MIKNAGMKKIGNCPECGGRLALKRSWREITICCKDCGIKMSREKYGDLMDDYLEELLAFIPVDRI